MAALNPTFDWDLVKTDTNTEESRAIFFFFLIIFKVFTAGLTHFAIASEALFFSKDFTKDIST